jgi:hypothetical protein
MCLLEHYIFCYVSTYVYVPIVHIFICILDTLYTYRYIQFIHKVVNTVTTSPGNKFRISVATDISNKRACVQEPYIYGVLSWNATR